jgi:hypothetical protein
LQHGLRARGIPKEIRLPKANDLDSRFSKPRVHGSGRCEENDPCAALLEPQRALDGDLGLPARDGAVIGADHHGQGLAIAHDTQSLPPAVFARQH